MTKRNPTAALARKARITATEFAGLCNGRIARLHFQRASLEVFSGLFLMTGPSGRHSIAVSESDLDRLNGHWTEFATHSQNLYA